MIDTLLKGSIHSEFIIWFTFGLAVLLLMTLLRIVLIHGHHNRRDRKWETYSEQIAELVQNVRNGSVSDQDIRKLITPRIYGVYDQYIRENISTTADLDVTAERRIAEVSGYRDFLVDRIQRQSGWKLVLSLRALSYFRDIRNKDVFLNLLSKRIPEQALYSIGLGLALAGDTESVESIAVKIWERSGHNDAITYEILRLFGPESAPVLKGLLSRVRLDSGHAVIIQLLSEYRYSDIIPTVLKLLKGDPSIPLAKALLGAIEVIGSETHQDDIRLYLTHEDLTVRLAAVDAFSSIGGDSITEVLGELLEDDEWWVCRRAAEALIEFGYESGLEFLKDAAEQTGMRRAAACSVLAEYNFRTAGVKL